MIGLAVRRFFEMIPKAPWCLTVKGTLNRNLERFPMEIHTNSYMTITLLFWLLTGALKSTYE